MSNALNAITIDKWNARKAALTGIVYTMDWENNRRHFQVALTWASAAALLFLIWEVRLAFLLAFGAVLIAILLRAIASLIAAYTKIPKQFGLIAAATFIVAIVGVTAWLFGSRLSSDFANLLQQVKAGEQSLREMFAINGNEQLGSKIAEQGTSLITEIATSFVSASVQILEAVIVVAVTAIYLAAEPQLYRRGIAALFSAKMRPHVFSTIDLVEETLRLWLVGQLILMLLVGVLTFVGLWLIGLPNSFALGLIAGLTELVPYLGPFIGAIPALLVALTKGLGPALWTGGVYLGIHIFEGYLVAPLIERRFVTIPPALVLLGITVSSLLFGVAGLVLAAPLTVVTYILVRTHYVENPLEQEPSA